MTENASIANLVAGLKALNLNYSELQVQQIKAYLALLQKWNRVYNLTAIRNDQEIMTHHIFDSLAVARFFEPYSHILDVGTGAGLPGLILAILFPEKQFTLLDSNSKKTSFIKQVLRTTQLQHVLVETCRVEAYQPQVLFDCITSRAFASLGDFMEASQRLLQPQGHLLALKGPRAEQELVELDESQKNVKASVEAVQVPFLDEKRFVVEIAF